MITFAIIFKSRYYAWLSVYAVVFLVLIWLIPVIGVRRIVKKMFFNEEITAEIFTDKIEIVMQTKKSEKIIDLKQLIYDFKVLFVEGKPAFYLKVSTGSSDNIKPELVLEHFYQYLGLELHKFTFQVHRHDVYTGNPTDGFCSLNDMGEVIK